MTITTISKTDAARNQLSTAISLFFEDGDPVSIHALTAAALGILHDYFPGEGSVWDNNLIFHYHSIYIKDEHRKEWIEKVRDPANFFKHADRDLKNDKTEIEFTPEITAFHLLEAIRCLGIIEGNNFQFLPEFRVYIAWFALRYPHLIKDEGKLHFTGIQNTINPDNLSGFKTALTMLRAHPVPPAGDGSEYDAEDARQERYRKLGVRPGSRYLNVGVDNQVTWPQQETLVKFDRYHFVLMPKTRDNVQSIHIDLIANGLTDRNAMTVINRFLSIMTWCDDGFAIAQDGWSGNPIPVAVPKRNLAFMTTHQWIFDRRIPASEEARRALALYREARNAQENFMVSYAVLNFVKVIEIKHPGKEQVKKWFRDNFEPLKQQAVNSDTFARFARVCGSEKPDAYIYKACRIAVAHAGKDSKSDPDCAGELTRLHTAAEVLRVFARHFIKAELRISDIIDSDAPRPE